MKKIGSKMLLLFLATFLLLGLAPMITYAAETNNQGVKALETDEISVTTYPSAMVISRSSNSQKNLCVKVVAENGTVVKEWASLYEENGYQTVAAPLAGGTYVVSYCYLENMNNGNPSSANVFSNTVTVTEAGYEAGALNSDGEYVIDFANGAYICVDLAKDGNKAFYTYCENANEYINNATTWYAFPDATTTKIVVTNTDPDTTPLNFHSKENSNTGVKGDAFSMSVTFRDVSIADVMLGYGNDVVTIEGNVTTTTIGHKGLQDDLDNDIEYLGTLEIVGDKTTNPTYSAKTVSMNDNIVIANMTTVSVGRSLEDRGIFSTSSGSIKFLKIDSLNVFGGYGAVSGSKGVIFEDVRTFRIAAEMGNAVYSTSGNIQFENSFGEMSVNRDSAKVIVFDENKGINSKICVDYENGCTVTTGGSQINVTGNTTTISRNSLGNTLSITGEFVEEVVAIPPTIDVSTPGVMKLTKNPNDAWGIKIVDPYEVTISEDIWEINDDNTISLSVLDGGKYTVYYCSVDDMAWDDVNDRWTVVDEKAIKVSDATTTVTEVGYEDHYDEEDEEFIIDYKGRDGIIVIPSMNKAFAAMMSQNTVNLEEAFSARYYSYDGGDTWYKLPNQKIVVTNTNKAVEPEYFGVEELPIYNFEVTFRDVLIDTVCLGIGDAVLNVDGDVTVRYLEQWGGLEIVGKDKDDTFNACEIEAENDIKVSTLDEINIINPYANPYSGDAAIRSLYGNIEMEEVGSLYIEVCGVGINGTNVSLNLIDNIEILALRAGIFAYPMATRSSEFEMQEVGNLSITNCGKIKISSKEWVMPSNEEPVDNITPVEMAIGALEINIENVESLIISNAEAGMLTEGGNIVLDNIAAMDITGEVCGIGALLDVKLNNVSGTVTVTDVEGAKAVMSTTGSVYVTHDYRVFVMSGPSKDDADEMTLTDDVVSMDEMGAYFEISRVFTFDSFVEQVENEDLPEFQANNETKKSDIVNFIEELVEETGEEGLTFEILSFDMEPAKDSTNGSIELEVKFTYVEDGTTLTKTINTVIDIPLRAYVAEKYEEFEDAMANILGAEITSDNKALFSEALDLANLLLKDANKAELTETELAKVNADYKFLNESFALYEANLKLLIAEELAELVEKEAAIPEVDAITSEDKLVVEELINCIQAFKDKYAGKLTDEQKGQVESLLVDLEKRLNKIKELETQIDKIEDDVEAQPTYKDVTSENKEDIKDIIGDIDKVLENNKDNLSEEEIKDLEEQKKELEDMVEFIEKIEKYEPVAGDFENTTDSDENDKKGDLVNKSEELITIIPLDKIEKQHVAKGEKVQVYLVVTDISETVTKEDKELIDKVIGDKEVGAYIDLTLFKQIGDRDPKKVPNTNGMVQITVEVPADLLAENASVPGKYKIVRIHEGETTIIDTVFDKETGRITFETDRFSVYALVYESAIDVPNTGGATDLMPMFALLIVGIALIAVAHKRSLKQI